MTQEIYRGGNNAKTCTGLHNCYHSKCLHNGYALGNKFIAYSS